MRDVSGGNQLKGKEVDEEREKVKGGGRGGTGREKWGGRKKEEKEEEKEKEEVLVRKQYERDGRRGDGKERRLGAVEGRGGGDTEKIYT